MSSDRVSEIGASAYGTGGVISAWMDRHSSKVFILPAVIVILAFSIFPLIVSAYVAMTRFRLAPGGFELQWAGTRNFDRLLFGSEQYHFLGTFGTLGPITWGLIVIGAGVILFWLFRYFTRGRVTVLGTIGRFITAIVVSGIILLTAVTLSDGGAFGSLMVTLFYVTVGCTIQFGIALGLALLCAKPIRGRSFFRVVFFMPLMVTPVGIAYMFRMLADMSKGPLQPIWNLFGFADVSWANDAWAARMVVVTGDSWQWIAFIFIVLLAALESQPRDQIEAAQLDGAGPWQVFRDVTWPAIVPVAATVMLIRVIEAFKIIDLPNVLTNGGPGIATESMTLHAFFAWRTQDLGGSAAIGYMLLFVAVVVCVSFFNLVVQRQKARFT
ncbi:MAG: sugar ABC transporter permease [Pseudomonadota bacterium]